MMISGTYLDGITSRRVPARLEVLDYSQQTLRLHLQFENKSDETRNLEYSQLKIASRLANSPREVVFGNDELFITEDNDAIDSLLKSRNKTAWSGFLHRLETNLPLILVASVFTLAVIWVTLTVGIPKAANYIAHQLPDFANEHFGSSISVLDTTIFDPSVLPEARRQHVRDIAKPYLDAHYQLAPKLVFRSGMGANALALPDGYIIFTDDFVNLVKGDDELTAVLFHELGHLKHKHMLRRALQDSMVTLLVVFVTGDADAIDLLTGLPTLVLDMSYSREFEREADQYALEQLHTSDINVQAFATAMQQLTNPCEYVDQTDDSVKRILEDYDCDSARENNGEQSTKSPTRLDKVKDFLSTHPITQERIDMVDNYKKQHDLN